MRNFPTIALLALLAACNNNGPSGEPDGPLRTDEATGNATAKTTEQLQSGQAGELPPATAAPRFVGKWAAGEKKCESAAWQFTQTTLRTPAGSTCSFNRISEVPGGYDVQATCSAEGPPTSDTLEIRFAESAKAMLFDSNTIADTGLVFCGRDV